MRCDQRPALPGPAPRNDAIYCFILFLVRNSSPLKCRNSATGQLVFNALAKTYACSWDGTTIEIMDGLIRLPEPYTADSLEGGDAASNARLRKVVRGWACRRLRRGGWVAGSVCVLV